VGEVGGRVAGHPRVEDVEHDGGRERLGADPGWTGS
ncbi:MAG: hypothetical protein V7646_960, partial [Pseudonocardia sp.]